MREPSICYGADDVDDPSDLLPPRPEGKRNPLPMTSERAERVHFDNIEKFKNCDCKFYERCLTVAAAQNWPQFHCGECDAYEELPEDAIENRVFQRLAAMLGGVVG